MSTRRLQPSRFGSLRRLSRRSSEAESTCAWSCWPPNTTGREQRLGPKKWAAGPSGIPSAVKSSDGSSAQVRRQGKLLQFIAHSASVACGSRNDEMTFNPGNHRSRSTGQQPASSLWVLPVSTTLVRFGASIPPLALGKLRLVSRRTGIASAPICQHFEILRPQAVGGASCGDWWRRRGSNRDITLTKAYALQPGYSPGIGAGRGWEAGPPTWLTGFSSLRHSPSVKAFRVARLGIPSTRPGLIPTAAGGPHFIPACSCATPRVGFHAAHRSVPTISTAFLPGFDLTSVV